MMTQTIADKALARIYGKGRGWTFSQVDFNDLGSRSAIDSILQRLTKQEKIRRVLPGVYLYPRYSKLLEQELGPEIRGVAETLARKFAWSIQPTGFAALNYIGLSTQVPAQLVYTSDGPTREYQIGKSTLRFKHAAPRKTKFREFESGIIVEALQVLGQDRITKQTIQKIRQWLPASKRARVLKDTKNITDWIYHVIKQICREESHG